MTGDTHSPALSSAIDIYVFVCVCVYMYMHELQQIYKLDLWFLSLKFILISIKYFHIIMPTNTLAAE